ncbi:hypothetical protein KAFR_0H01050 [Kazachstania africana CBS 2517]|uniref:N-acetyltransferase domain-containing protein n=1 Tax=Kazachstania africana (strain ATCC 22294 / BCRC 22015 / CBS 2517 / CECT 1963 / NBRC 1671 / NRRL Y-8276) TaxID=1071382 RepID=H2AYV9_KAZAF|nr:hypothetical protein KAFR_0H01050 [Kazachstania africana CBS 2517]CCF59515.1 hypothetical protein KAFR_0H01050 [Kazachstania africana CBS 2517]
MKITYRALDLNNDVQLNKVKQLIDADLSEPYSIYVYRYFLNQWPELALLAFDIESEDKETPIGCIISKSECHAAARERGYIGMLAVDHKYRRMGIAKNLAKLAIVKMKTGGCDEIMLETEVDNFAALNLYESLGFIRVKRMYKYYLNHGDAYRLILPLTEKAVQKSYILNEELR